MKLVVDASVCVGWFLNVSYREHAMKVLMSGWPMLAPEWLVAEVTSVAWKMVKADMATDALVHRMLKELPIYFSLVPMAGLSHSAYRLSRELNHSPYDCYYLALAERENAPMVTADRRLVSKLTGTSWASMVIPLDQWRQSVVTT
ncbi:MAG: type II toxin-antitoxin system VapC family toxin [Magnetococcales bacterium]|nr:type II toxin-antitoxin system VapC family toxin [Magnetococcales bacterium]MBF0155026.1 type II toxin-antitoxin system VapC family toxin [Magnetococcales bacterium]